MQTQRASTTHRFCQIMSTFYEENLEIQTYSLTENTNDNSATGETISIHVFSCHIQKPKLID